MRPTRNSERMTRLDLRAIVALRQVRGMSGNAQRIADSLLGAARRHQPTISIRQRFALYSICWRFRRQVPMPVQVKITIALAEAKAAAEEFRMNQPEPQTIRGSRSPLSRAAPAPIKRNPLDDLFPETVDGWTEQERRVNEFRRQEGM